MTMTDLFIAKIKEKQANLQKSNSDFASYLGVSRQLWEGTIREVKPFALGPSVAFAAKDRFPDLLDLFLAWTQERRTRRQRPYTRSANASAADATSASAVGDNANASRQLAEARR